MAMEYEEFSISLFRLSQHADSLRTYEIILDEKVVGYIGAGLSFSITTSPGYHEMRLRIDWCYSNRIGFHINPGEQLQLECGNSFSGWKILTLIIPLFYITFGRMNYLFIRRNESINPCPF